MKLVYFEACLSSSFVQHVLGMAFGERPLLGIIAGSVTLVGGPASGLAFAPLSARAARL